MLSYFRLYRERGWHPISAEEYRAVWLRWGGSVATHPDVVERLSDLAGIAVRYLGWLKRVNYRLRYPRGDAMWHCLKTCLSNKKKRSFF